MSTVTCRCGRTWQERHRGALRHYVNYARYNTQYQMFQMLAVAMVHSRLDYGNAVLAGLRAYLHCRLQSVLNASARLIYRLGFRDHITDAVISLHWLRVRERIEFKLATLACKLLYNQALSYLGPLVRVADVPGRRALRCANTECLMVPHVRLSSVGNRTFSVAACRVCNNLPASVTAHSGDISKHSCFSDLFWTSP